MAAYPDRAETYEDQAKAQYPEGSLAHLDTGLMDLAKMVDVLSQRLEPILRGSEPHAVGHDIPEPVSRLARHVVTLSNEIDKLRRLNERIDL